jgi:FMN phosphatase YigB (HAD superfamily)
MVLHRGRRGILESVQPINLIASREHLVPSPPRLIVTDLDNTLYDWVEYFVTAFYAMVDELALLIPIERDALLDEFREVHRHHHNSEHPFAVLELPSVKKHFDGSSPTEVLQALGAALVAFNRARRQTLVLYPGVRETLTDLRTSGVTIVGHTEALGVQAYARLEMLDVRQYFQHLYALDLPIGPHPRSGPIIGDPSPDFIHLIPPAERKPNPALLLDICRQQGVDPSETWYVGDSLTRDMSMAKRAGTWAIWARYGTRYDKNKWGRLVRVTHWTDEDVQREAELKRQFADVKPDVSIDSFADISRLLRGADLGDNSKDL